MIAVIFEVWPAENKREAYLSLAASMREELMKMDGFISIDRFDSLYDSGKMLSLQFWRDEASIEAWRLHLDHRRMQVLGRNGVFKDYRLRVASVVRDYGMSERAEAPDDSKLLFGS